MRGKLAIGAIGIVIGVLLSTAAVVLAGGLDPSGGPTAPASQMFTLEQIYQRLATGAAGTKMASFSEPSSGPGSTMHTLNDIMAKLPALDGTNGAKAADVANGKTFWGLTSGQWGLRTGTASGAATTARVPKTGQTASLATGDDGDLERGVAWPNPRFTDNGNGTVTDNLTGLIWLRLADCAAADRNWATALTDVAQLNAAGTMNDLPCGDTSKGGSHQTDWRLPNVRELYSLVHSGFANPALPNTAGTGRWTEAAPFSSVQSGNYWSGTGLAGDTSKAWYVSFSQGGLLSGAKTSTYLVWPVRGGQ